MGQRLGGVMAGVAVGPGGLLGRSYAGKRKKAQTRVAWPWGTVRYLPVFTTRPDITAMRHLVCRYCLPHPLT